MSQANSALIERVLRLCMQRIGCFHSLDSDGDFGVTTHFSAPVKQARVFELRGGQGKPAGFLTGRVLCHVFPAQAVHIPYSRQVLEVVAHHQRERRLGA